MEIVNLNRGQYRAQFLQNIYDSLWIELRLQCSTFSWAMYNKIDSYAIIIEPSAFEVSPS